MSARFAAIALVACSNACVSSAPPAPSSSPAPVAAPTRAAQPTPTSVPAPSVAAAAPNPVRAESVVVPVALHAEPFLLPGAVGAVSLDYLFYEPQPSRVWVPAGGTGSVDVFDTVRRELARIEGFTTAEREGHGRKRVVGPSAGSLGDGVAYIGNRATQEVCVVDLRTLTRGSCLKLAAPTDGVAYVAATKEVWVTTPQTQALVVLDATNPRVLKQKSTIKLAGEPEGYAVDEAHGWFLTNLEDKGSTLVLDFRTHAIKETWNAGCSSDGPRGIAVDSARNLAFVACTDHVQALDMAHAGAQLGKLDTGAGVDNIDYAAASALLYAAAGKAARLTIARVSDRGDFSVVASSETAPGARNAVADAHGDVYVADPQAGRLLVLRRP